MVSWTLSVSSNSVAHPLCYRSTTLAATARLPPIFSPPLVAGGVYVEVTNILKVMKIQEWWIEKLFKFNILSELKITSRRFVMVKFMSPKVLLKMLAIMLGHISEKILKVFKNIIIISGFVARGLTKIAVSYVVVLPPLFLVTQNLIGLGDFAEFINSVGFWPFVWVVFQRQPTKRLLNLLLCCLLWNSCNKTTKINIQNLENKLVSYPNNFFNTNI